MTTKTISCSTMFRSTLGSPTIPSLQQPVKGRHQLLKVAYSTAPSDKLTPPVIQLSRLRDLIQEAGSTNRPTEKQQILAEYPDLKELLEQ
jgi:hypothetical protein